MRDVPFTYQLPREGEIPPIWDNHVTRTLSSMQGQYLDQSRYEAMLRQEDTLIYEVYEIKRPEVAGELIQDAVGEPTLSSKLPKAGHACLRSGFFIQPIHNTGEVHRRCCDHELQMRFLQSPVAGTPHVQSKPALRNCASNSGSFAITFAKHIGVLLLLALLDHFKQRLLMERECAAVVSGTLVVNGTRFTFHALKLHARQFVVTPVVTHRPRITDVSLRASDGSLLPINGENVHFVAGGVLPGVFLDHWPQQIDGVIALAVIEQRGGGVAHIDQMVIRQ
jgi:hypothetical protein